MRTNRHLLWSALLAAGCASQSPAPKPPPQPQPVVLGTYEGEIDPAAGTFTVRSTGLQSTQGQAGPNLAVIVSGASTVTIANDGTPLGPVDGTGACAGQQVMSGKVQMALGYPSPGFAGGLYAENTWVSASGSEACNSDPAPAGLSATYGLWSYGTIRPGATTTTSTKVWQFKWASGQKVSFRGRIVGVPGTTFTNLPNPQSNGNSYSPVIAYTRTYTGGTDGVAYADKDNARLVYLDLAGSSLGTITTPGVVYSVASYNGATANDDLLWFTTTNGYVGVVYRGQVYSVSTGLSGVKSIAFDPSTPTRAWYVSAVNQKYGYVDFDTTTPAANLGTSWGTVGIPYSLAFGPAKQGYTGTWLWIASDAAYDWQYSSPGSQLLGYSSGGATPVAASASPCAYFYTLVRSPEGKLWFPTWTSAAGFVFCSYDPAQDAAVAVPVPGGSGSLGVARSVTGSGDAVWGMAWTDPRRATELQEGKASDAMFAVDLPDSSGSTVSTLCGSPAVGSHPAYLWWTSNQAIYRLAPQ